MVSDIEQQLLTVYDDPMLCKQYAWWTLETITQLSKAQLIARDQIDFSLDQEIALQEWLKRLIIKKEPIQYLIGSVKDSQKGDYDTAQPKLPAT